MVFSSNIFLFIFLPIFLLAYYATPGRYKSALILLGSYAFYAWWRVDFLLLFMLVTLWNYLLGLVIAQRLAHQVSAKPALLLGVGVDLLVLGYFKYINFGVDSLNHLVDLWGGQAVTMAKVVLPIGISFYIFQAVSYLVDVYRRDVAATRNLVDFAAFIALFPQLIAGPVIRYKDIADQFEHRVHSVDKFAEGVRRFMRGFIKKVFIADSLAGIADTSFAMDSPSASDAWIGALAYTAQLYFDFSGYSDMAIGLGLMMGFRFLENFDHPYISCSITEFWRRWHISLSRWLKDYLYIPLGGNRGGTWMTYRNLILTMLLGGLWHGANWTFVLWGAWHGIWLALEKALRKKPDSPSLSTWATTFLLVVLGWVMFRAENVAEAWRMYKAMFSADWVISEHLLGAVSSTQWAIMLLAYLVLLYPLLKKNVPQLQKITTGRLVPVMHLVLSTMFLVTCFRLSAQSFSPFLYFQF